MTTPVHQLSQSSRITIKHILLDYNKCKWTGGIILWKQLDEISIELFNIFKENHCGFSLKDVTHASLNSINLEKNLIFFGKTNISVCFNVFLKLYYGRTILSCCEIRNIKYRKNRHWYWINAKRKLSMFHTRIKYTDLFKKNKEIN